MKRQYVIPPPSIPVFLYRFHKTAWLNLMQWAKNEFQARLIYCAENGYWKELKWLNENSSAISVLAELSGFRKMCAVMGDRVWHTFTARERSFIRRSLELQSFLRH
jgi:hypothetical protein